MYRKETVQEEQNEFEQVSENIFRLKVAFEDIYTSVFALGSVDGGYIIADTASNKGDVEEHILPAIEKFGIGVTGIFISHNHGDHSGGLESIANHYSEVNIFAASKEIAGRYNKCIIPKDGEILGGRFRVLYLPGHTDDTLGILDTNTGILLSFDALQLYGVGNYGTGIEYKEKYLNTINRLEQMNLNGIIASHDYVTLGSTAIGQNAVCTYLDECRSAVNVIENFAKVCNFEDCEQIASEYNKISKKPPIHKYTVSALLK